MPRYLIQRNHFTCGPIAIINAEKWSGINSTADRLPDLIDECGTDRSGTKLHHWDYVIRNNAHFICRHWRSHTLILARHHLEDGGGLFMDYIALDDTFHHLVFIAGINIWHKTYKWLIKNHCDYSHDCYHSKFRRMWRRRFNVWRVWRLGESSR